MSSARSRSVSQAAWPPSITASRPCTRTGVPAIWTSSPCRREVLRHLLHHGPEPMAIGDERIGQAGLGDAGGADRARRRTTRTSPLAAPRSTSSSRSMKPAISKKFSTAGLAVNVSASTRRSTTARISRSASVESAGSDQRYTGTRTTSAPIASICVAQIRRPLHRRAARRSARHAGHASRADR